MRLADLLHRAIPPEPWAEGDNLPWDEPGFSARMLREHLSQAHDAASRRLDKIDAHVTWIHQAVLRRRPSRVLDLGCGPGLYSHRLAALGHTCTGIDFSPASIAHACAQAAPQNLACQFVHDDIRAADFGAGYDLVMLLFGEFNVFRPQDAERILRKARAALREGGTLLLEPHTYAAVLAMGQQPARWSAQPSGLFSDRPHLTLNESFWHAREAAVTVRYFVVDLETGGVTRFAQTFQAYSAEAYRDVLTACGFGRVTSYPSLIGAPDETQAGLCAIVAQA